MVVYQYLLVLAGNFRLAFGKMGSGKKEFVHRLDCFINDIIYSLFIIRMIRIRISLRRIDPHFLL